MTDLRLQMLRAAVNNRVGFTAEESAFALAEIDRLTAEVADLQRELEDAPDLEELGEMGDQLDAAQAGESWTEWAVRWADEPDSTDPEAPNPEPRTSEADARQFAASQRGEAVVVQRTVRAGEWVES